MAFRDHAQAPRVDNISLRLGTLGYAGEPVFEPVAESDELIPTATKTAIMAIRTCSVMLAHSLANASCMNAGRLLKLIPAP